MSQHIKPNPLERYFKNNKARRIIKWIHYFNIYHQYFAKFRRKNIKIIEFGVAHGGSLQMWKHYFGKKAKVYGVDIDPKCLKIKEESIEIFIGDQSNKHFLKQLTKKIGAIDIVIDDGGHFMQQQITTFEVMFPQIKNGGLYITEDVHTSYWKEFGGGYKKDGTFIEYTKDLIDQMHAWHSQHWQLKTNAITRMLRGIHIYNSLIVFEKDDVNKSHSEETGRF